MPKKDTIFWWATSIFILSVFLFYITQNQWFLALMILSYLLRPTLASLGLARRYVDERQLTIHYRSGNIAFGIMIIACIMFGIYLEVEGNPAWETYNMMIIIGLASKALLNVLLAENPREAASTIIISAGLLLTLFVAMNQVDHGLSWKGALSVLPTLGIVALGVLSRHYPRTMGTLVLAAAAALVILILSKDLGWGSLGTALIVGVPLITAAVNLFRPGKIEPQMD